MNAAGCDSRYDIVIAGGGMIGTSLALALAPLGLRVAVVEAVARKDPGQPSFCLLYTSPSPRDED